MGWQVPAFPWKLLSKKPWTDSQDLQYDVRFYTSCLSFCLVFGAHLGHVFSFTQDIFFPWSTSHNLWKGKILQSQLYLFPIEINKNRIIKSLDHQIVLQFRLNPWNFSRKKKLNFHSVPLTYMIYPIVHGSLQFISFYIGFYIGFLAITIINCCCNCGCRKKINEMKWKKCWNLTVVCQGNLTKNITRREKKREGERIVKRISLLIWQVEVLRYKLQGALLCTFD